MPETMTFVCSICLFITSRGQSARAGRITHSNAKAATSIERMSDSWVNLD